MENLNKKALADRIAEYDNFSTKVQAQEFLDDIIGLIVDTIVDGKVVSIAGFGKFESYTRTNGQVVPKFRAFTKFKEAVAAKA
jgi:nucleoid DNA-binding protein